MNMTKLFKNCFVIGMLFCLVACSPSNRLSEKRQADSQQQIAQRQTGRSGGEQPGYRLSKQELVSRIATNFQSLSSVQFGPIQLMQYKTSLEQMNYSYEELVELDQAIVSRIESEKIYLHYSEQMYEHLLRAMKEQQQTQLQQQIKLR